MLGNGKSLILLNLLREIARVILLSPYLFVLRMKYLGHLTEQSVATAGWYPIKLSRHRPKISHLHLADNLVLFGKVELCQAEIISDILHRFCFF